MAKPPNIPTDDVSDVDLSGRRFGDYRILRRLGHGAMAVVYLAQDLKHNRKVALKVLEPELSAVVGGECASRLSKYFMVTVYRTG